jgi:hypothetical protein
MSQNSDWDIVDLNKDIPKKVSQKILSKIKIVEDKIDNLEQINLKIIDQNNTLITLMESLKSNKGLKCLFNKTNQPGMFVNRLTNTAWRQNYITTPNLSVSNLNHLNEINEINEKNEKNDISEKNDMNDID